MKAFIFLLQSVMSVVQNWESITTNMPKNTPGWRMGGSFEITDSKTLNVTLTVTLPKNHVSNAREVYQ